MHVEELIKEKQKGLPNLANGKMASKSDLELLKYNAASCSLLYVVQDFKIEVQTLIYLYAIFRVEK